MPKAIAQITIRDETDISVSATAPINPILNQLWLDTNSKPSQLKKFSGTVWEIVNEVTIGGRNLIKNTAFKTDLTSWVLATGVTLDKTKVLDGRNSAKVMQTGLVADAWRGIAQSYLIAKEGDKFTASIYTLSDNIAGIDNGAAIEIRYYNSTNTRITQSSISIKPAVNNAWQRFFITGVCPAGTVKVEFTAYVTRNGTLWLNGEKLECGNLVTDWTAAEEDLETTVTTLQTQFNTANGKIDTLVKDTTITKDGIDIKLKDAYSATEQTVGGVKTKVENLETEVTGIDGLKNRMNSAEQKLTADALVTTIISSSITSDGKMLYTDPTFKYGANGINTYNNNGNGVVTTNRIAKPSDCPTSSGHSIEVKTAATGANPGNGGFYFGNQARANATFLYKITAKIQMGLELTFATNAIGDGAIARWITDNKGTGTYKEYIFKVVCGSSGQFSSTGFFYLNNGTPPLTWYLASATVIDLGDIADVAGELSNSVQNGAVINTVSTVTDRNGFTVNNGAITIRNKAGQAVLSGDTNGNLTVTGTITGSSINGGRISGTTMEGSVIAGSDITANNILKVQGSPGKWGELHLISAWGKKGTLYSNDQRGINISSDEGVWIQCGSSAYFQFNTNGDLLSGGKILLNGPDNTVYGMKIGNSTYMHVNCNDGARGVNWWSSDLKIKDHIIALNKNSEFIKEIDEDKLEKRRTLLINESAIDIIKRIEHFSYHTSEGETSSCGYIAQQLQGINAEFVFEVPQPDKIRNAEDEEVDNPLYDVDDPVIRNPKPSAIIPYLSKAIQEQQEQIESLKNENAKLVERMLKIEELLGIKGVV